MTENTVNRSEEIEALERLLATCGADRTRWPLPARRRFAGLVASDAEAQRLVREAAALDSLLDLAPSPNNAASHASPALAARIVAAALAAGDDETHGAGTRRTQLHVLSGAAMSPALSRVRRAVPTSWAAGALMAASVLIGAFFGMTGALDLALEPFAQAAAGDAETEVDASQIAFGLDLADLFAEDLL